MTLEEIKKATGDRLTPRELEVVYLFTQGYGNKDIAQQLEMAYATVRIHVHNIATKLGVHTKPEVLAILMRHLEQDRDRRKAFISHVYHCHTLPDLCCPNV